MRYGGRVTRVSNSILPGVVWLIYVGVGGCDEGMVQLVLTPTISALDGSKKYLNSFLVSPTSTATNLYTAV